MLIAICAPVLWTQRRRIASAALALAASVLLINGSQYWRNIDLSGSPLGYDSAQGDGFFRWRNERFGWRETASNLVRHFADQLGSANSNWNQRVYGAVVRGHGWIGIDASDPATTWRWTKFEPPKNTNHEADAHNRWHLLLLAVACAFLPRKMRLYASGIVVGLLLFCFYLKWQLFMARMFLPLFVLGAPLAGAFIGRWKWPLAQAALCLFLLNNARRPVFENWTRPLKGPSSLLRTARDDNYFNDMSKFGNQRQSYREAVDRVVASGCALVGIDSTQFQLEYPFQALLRERTPQARFIHTGVKNASARYQPATPERPCAVVCLLCEGVPEKRNEYREYPRVVDAGSTILFLGGE